MSGQLKTVYPMTAVFNISGYYDASMVQALIGIMVLLACAVLALFMLKGLEQESKIVLIICRTTAKEKSRRAAGNRHALNISTAALTKSRPPFLMSKE